MRSGKLTCRLVPPATVTTRQSPGFTLTAAKQKSTPAPLPAQLITLLNQREEVCGCRFIFTHLCLMVREPVLGEAPSSELLPNLQLQL